uniref:Uncharacterized protein n=1 Tax=Denticeps clupeoides TaxID=299321 RepID=A0AAY4BHM2_9TELE
MKFGARPRVTRVFIPCAQLSSSYLCFKLHLASGDVETMSTPSNVPSYMSWSLVTTLCCCLPVGILALVFSNKVNTANASGDTANAEQLSRKAKYANIAGTVFGIIMIITIISLKAVEMKKARG